MSFILKNDAKFMSLNLLF